MDSNLTQDQTPNTEHICQHCGKPVYDDDALLCLYCGESLGRKVGFISSLGDKTLNGTFIFVILLIVISIFLWLVM